ncbi:MAG: dihydroxyacetone kinase subunit DhaK [Clostridiales bacterium]|nr:dihydroxyacetone kinase subunit DhaK [Clostridiales bacterium]
MNWFEETRDYYGARWFAGMELAYPQRWKLFHGNASSATLMKRTPTKDRVAVIISGGGSDGPLLPGYVGEGLADACIVGAPYCAPNAYAIYEAGLHLGAEKGVLLLYNNFAGDFLNNDMAAELLHLDNVMVESVAATDDMGMAVGEPRENRGGRCSLPFLIKLAANAAKDGLSLQETAALVRKANDRCTTLCVAVDLQQGQISYGNGFSGEPGFRTETHMDVKRVAQELSDMVLEDLKPREGEKLMVLLNRLRLTSYADSYNMALRVHESLSKHFEVAQLRVGAFSNILDVYGYTLTLLCADAPMQKYLENTIGSDSFLL